MSGAQAGWVPRPAPSGVAVDGWRTARWPAAPVLAGMAVAFGIPVWFGLVGQWRTIAANELARALITAHAGEPGGGSADDDRAGRGELLLRFEGQGTWGLAGKELLVYAVRREDDGRLEWVCGLAEVPAGSKPLHGTVDSQRERTSVPRMLLPQACIGGAGGAP